MARKHRFNKNRTVSRQRIGATDLLTKLTGRMNVVFWNGLQELHDQSCTVALQLAQSAQILQKYIESYGHVPLVTAVCNTVGQDLNNVTQELLTIRDGWAKRPGIVSDDDMNTYLEIVDMYRLCGERFQTCMQQAVLELTTVAKVFELANQRFEGQHETAEGRKIIYDFAMGELAKQTDALAEPVAEDGTQVGALLTAGLEAVGFEVEQQEVEAAVETKVDVQEPVTEATVAEAEDN